MKPLKDRAIAASAPPPSWWTRKDLTWEQWTALSKKRAEQMNAVTTGYDRPRKTDD